MEYQWKTDGEERWRTDVIEAEIEKIDAMCDLFNCSNIQAKS